MFLLISQDIKRTKRRQVLQHEIQFNLSRNEMLIFTKKRFPHNVNIISNE